MAPVKHLLTHHIIACEMHRILSDGPAPVRTWFDRSDIRGDTFTLYVTFRGRTVRSPAIPTMALALSIDDFEREYCEPLAERLRGGDENEQVPPHVWEYAERMRDA